MALRLGGFADLDPGAVPLPAGTEVVTHRRAIAWEELRPCVQRSKDDPIPSAKESLADD